MTVLHIDSSARTTGSVSRLLTAEVVAQLDGPVLRRDLAEPIPHVTESWIVANTTAPDQRDPLQEDTLALSDALVGELQAADTIVIGVPLYNFGVPAALKAWIDQICRSGVTFQYGETGPVGLLEGKRAIVVMATGGVPTGNPVDFASPYVRQVLGFIGIQDVEIVSADQLSQDMDAGIAKARAQIAALHP